MPLLDPVDGLPVQAGALGEPLLTESGSDFAAGGADVVADGSAAVEDPGGWWSGWHRSTLSGSWFVVCIVDRTFQGEAHRVIATPPEIKHSFEWNPPLIIVQA